MKKFLSIIVVAFLMLPFAACLEPESEANVSSVAPDDADSMNLGEQYLNPVFYAGITRNSWGDASEINADKLVTFYVWAARHKTFDFDIPENLYVNEDGDASVPADIIESAIRQYFDVSSEHMRRSEYYNAETNAYMIFGLGGASSCEVVNVTPSGDIIEIEFNDYQDGELYQTVKLTIKSNGDTYKYYSCNVEAES